MTDTIRCTYITELAFSIYFVSAAVNEQSEAVYLSTIPNSDMSAALMVALTFAASNSTWVPRMLFSVNVKELPKELSSPGEHGQRHQALLRTHVRLRGKVHDCINTLLFQNV